MENDKALVKNNKLIGLEIIRFISSFAVLIWHYQHFCYVADMPMGFVKEDQPFYELFSFFYNYGAWGVQVFWSISGFIFFWKYQDTISKNLITAWRFSVLRFSRLYPLHLLTLIIVLILQYLYFHKNNYSFVYQYNDFYHFFLQLFLASNWGIQKGYSFNGPIWSVSVEVIVYFFFFLTLRIVKKPLMTIVGVLVICGIAKLMKGVAPIIDCFAFFYMGGLTSIFLNKISGSRYEKSIKVMSQVGLVFFPVICVLLRLHTIKYFAFVFLMCYAPLIIFVLSQDISLSPKWCAIIESLGNLTYASYLIHFPIQLFIALLCSYIQVSIPMYSSAFFISFIGSTFFLSFIIFRFFEMPLQSMIRKRLQVS